MSRSTVCPAALCHAGRRFTHVTTNGIASAITPASANSAAQERGLIVNAPNASTIRIAPAYTIGDAEVDEFLTLFRDALAAVAQTQEIHS